MNQSPVMQYRIPLPFADAEQAVRQALQAQGFGILTEVDVAAVFRAKLGIETLPQKLLGACNPVLARASLDADPRVGAFLPCGVALRQGETAGETIAALQDPGLLSALFATADLEAPAAEARRRLDAALTSLGARC